MAKQPTWGDRFRAREHPQNQLPIMKQCWRHLLFLHWEYEAEWIQQMLPPGLYVDQFNGKAYVGIVAFLMDDIQVKWIPSILSKPQFLELNLRTYVYDENGLPGIWFYSLDANHFLAVQIGRLFFHLPYRLARMELKSNEEDLDFLTMTCQRNGEHSELNYSFKSSENCEKAKPGSLEFFLVERYLLYTLAGKQLKKGYVYHNPYSICRPQLKSWDSRLFSMDHLIDPLIAPQHILYSPGVDVDVYPLKN